MAGGAKRWIEAGKGNNKADVLQRYVDDLSGRLTAPVPAKHAGAPEAYREYIRREIASHKAKVDALRFSEPAKK